MRADFKQESGSREKGVAFGKMLALPP